MYLIGAFNNGKKAQKWFDSLPVLGTEVEAIVVQYLRRGKFDKVNVKGNVKLVKYKKEYPGNTGKHKDFREILAPMLTQDTYCMFTDMHDVVFQAPLPELPRTPIIATSEGKKFGEIPYWEEIFPRNLHKLDVYNVGTFVMQRDVLLGFWDYLHTNWCDFYAWYKNSYIPMIGSGDTFPFNIPFHEKVRVEMAVMFNSHYDTLCFNEFIRKYEFVEVPELFGCYGYQVETGRLTFKGKKLYYKDQLVTVAHYNGKFKKAYERKEVKK